MNSSPCGSPCPSFISPPEHQLLHRTMSSCSHGQAFDPAFWSLPQPVLTTQSQSYVSVSIYHPLVHLCEQPWHCLKGREFPTVVWNLLFACCYLSFCPSVFISHMESSFLSHMYISIPLFLPHLSHLLLCVCLKGIPGYFSKHRSQCGIHCCVRTHWLDCRDGISGFSKGENLIQKKKLVYSLTENTIMWGHRRRTSCGKKTAVRHWLEEVRRTVSLFQKPTRLPVITMNKIKKHHVCSVDKLALDRQKLSICWALWWALLPKPMENATVSDLTVPRTWQGNNVYWCFNFPQTAE